jgi:hypothetical protein
MMTRIEGYERLADEFVDYMIEYYHFECTPSEYLYHRLVDELWERGIIKKETCTEKDGRVFYVSRPVPAAGSGFIYPPPIDIEIN